MQKFAAELFGTFFLVLAIGISGDPVTSGLFIVALVTVTGRISGAHFNPAVTLAFWSSGRLSGTDFGFYCLSQLTGALFGAFCVYLMSGVVDYAVPASYSGPLQYSFIEMAFTMILALVYLTLFMSGELKNYGISVLVIGFTYAGLFAAGESISGAVFNPAMALATSLAGLSNNGDPGVYLPVYLLAPLAGGLIAGRGFLYFEKAGNSGEGA